MNPQITAQANQAAQQGQSALADYNNKATNYGTSYGNYANQANQAQQGVSDYTKQMQGAYDPNTGVGNATSMYNYGLNDQLARTGYNPAQMAAATGNLNQANGSLSAYNDFANQAASKWGLNAGGFAAANAGALGNINNNITAQQGVVNGMMDKYKTAQTGANQFAGLGIQGQHETLGGLQSVFTNAANQRDSAYESMKFYQGLAQTQGGLNASQQKDYALAQQAYAASQQALAQASLFASQTTGQNLTNTQSQNYMNSPAYKNSLNGAGNQQALAQQGGQYDPATGNWKMPDGHIITSNGLMVKDTSTNPQSAYMNIGQANPAFGVGAVKNGTTVTNNYTTPNQVNAATTGTY